MLDVLKNLIKNEEAQGMTEYALVLGVIPFGALLFFPSIRNGIQNLYENVAAVLDKIIK